MFLATDGEGYETQMGRWSRRLAPLLINFAGGNPAGRHLDAGCGTGSLTCALAGHPDVERVVGVDVSPDYISYAARLHASPRIEFEVGDITELRFENAAFDGVWSSLVLQFVTDPHRAVAHMCRVTKPGGVVAAATWDTRGGVVAQRMFWDTAAVIDPDAASYRATAFVRPMSRPDGLREAWRAAGLAHVEIESLTIRMEFTSFADFWSSVDSRNGPYAAYLSTREEAMKQAVRRLVRHAYLDGEPDGLRSYAATAWTVKGTVQ
jgi:ubiquinone/menaquinone biosynthesis C-methylase UbiE